MSISERIPGMKPGHRIRNLGLGFLYFVLIMGVLGVVLPDPEGGSETAPETTTAAETMTTSAIDGGTTTTEEPTTSVATATTASITTTTTTATTQPTTTATTTTTTATTTVEPAEDGESYEFSGSGNSVTDSFTAEGGLVVLDFQHDGDSNFQVQAVSSSGEEYIVNEIGAYDGQVALSLDGEYRLDITADGSWSADVTQPRFNENDVEDLPESADGEHAAWLGPFEFKGSEVVTFEIENDAQAAVWLASHEGEKVSLLHNEIGPYDGEALITNSGFGLIVIETDSADWRIEIER